MIPARWRLEANEDDEGSAYDRHISDMYDAMASILKLPPSINSIAAIALVNAKLKFGQALRKARNAGLSF